MMPRKSPEKPKRKIDYTIKDSGERREFSTGAVRDMSGQKGRFDLIPMETLRALAIHFQRGCEKYGERNFERGIPVHSLLDSAMRHLAAVIDGKDEENHLVSSIWNLFVAYQTILRIQEGKLPEELYDLPHKIILPDPYNEYIMEITKNPDEMAVYKRSRKQAKKRL